MSPDPSGLVYADLTDPQNFNLYSYVRNNPLRFVDPTGLDCVYLNNAGDGVDKDGIDHNSNQGECSENGGYWAPGNVSGNSSVHTSGSTDLIGIDSTSNGQGVFSVANCSGCSTTNSDGTLTGAMTQTFGNISAADFSYAATVYNVSSGLDALKSIGLGGRINAWLDQHDGRLQRLACNLSPGTAMETRDAMDTVRGVHSAFAPSTPSGNTDAGGASNIFMPNINSRKGYGPMGSAGVDSKFNAAGTAVQYAVDRGACLNSTH